MDLWDQWTSRTAIIILFDSKLGFKIDWPKEKHLPRVSKITWKNGIILKIKVAVNTFATSNCSSFQTTDISSKFNNVIIHQYHETTLTTLLGSKFYTLNTA